MLEKNTEGKILIIEDQLDIQLSAKLLLKKYFMQVDAQDSPYGVLSALKNNFYHVILLDMNFSRGESTGREGLAWLKKITQASPKTKVITMTAFADIELAILSIKTGAFDFIVKPWENDKLVSVVKEAYQIVKRETESEKILSSTSTIIPEFIKSQSPKMKSLLDSAERVAKTDVSILLLGENGTGKEMVAQHIHQHSERKNKPFVKVDLGAIPATLFESELFGHKKGAFTDAHQDKKGWFEIAEGGTLFLDEIGNIPMSLQVKLLTVLQNKTITPIGLSQKIPIDVRIISATNMSLQPMIQNGDFRKDLYYRINTLELFIQPLKYRQEDILLFAEKFLNEFTKIYSKPNLSLSEKSKKALQSYSWPGNIRELRHTMERAVILCTDKTLQPENLDLSETTPSDLSKTEEMNLETLEKQAIEKALSFHNGNISQAAKELGLTRAALYRRIEKYGF